MTGHHDARRPRHLRRRAPAPATLAALVAVTLTGCSTPEPIESGATETLAARPRALVTDLLVPWGVAFLPDGSALITQRDEGSVLHVIAGRRADLAGTVKGVQFGGEGGLLGIAVSPDYAADHFVFLYLTTAKDNRVMRCRYTGGKLTPDRVIVSGIPRGNANAGGALAFGPDGNLYIGTGDAGKSTRAQDKGSLGGKILRVTKDGKAAANNPLGPSAIYSLGHRNVAGLAWDDNGRLLATESGQPTYDELNRIEAGGNYGWPAVEGSGDTKGGLYTNPVAYWPTAQANLGGLTIGPDGAAYIACVRGERIWKVPLLQGSLDGTPTQLLVGGYGRLRTVAKAPDGKLWIATANTAKGATPRTGDDRLLFFALSP